MGTTKAGNNWTLSPFKSGGNHENRWEWGESRTAKEGQRRAPFQTSGVGKSTAGGAGRLVPEALLGRTLPPSDAPYGSPPRGRAPSFALRPLFAIRSRPFGFCLIRRGRGGEGERGELLEDTGTPRTVVLAGHLDLDAARGHHARCFNPTPRRPYGYRCLRLLR